MPIDSTTSAPSASLAEAAALREEAEAALRALVGREDARLREDQWTAIAALLAGRRALVVQRTGWGKSAVYFVATALLRARGAGPSLIVSPLLALMRDQVAAASRAGIRAATINSSNVTEWDVVQEQIHAGEIDVLLCSPERLNNPAFRADVLPRLAASTGLLVVDEAHCVSDWGHDFRPDYRRIAALLASLPSGTPVLATTATANARVSADVAEQLAGPSTPAEVLVLRGSLDRESLRLAVLPRADAAIRLAWLADYLRDVPGSGIVYCLTVAMAEQVATQLRAAGHDVAAYTGRTEPAERERLEADLLANRVKTLVATSALGMGFDKPDLAFVVHLGAPSSPIAYYQQIGRAGRGVERADVVLAPGPEDRAIWDYFGSLAFPPEQTVRATLAALAEAPDQTSSTAKLETAVDLRRSRLETMLSVLDVDGAVQRVRGGWRLTGEPWGYDADRYARVAEARAREQEAMLAYEALGAGACRMAFLRQQLDDPELVGAAPAVGGDHGSGARAPASVGGGDRVAGGRTTGPNAAGSAEPAWRCGRCDLCAGSWLPGLPDAAGAEEVRARIARPGVELVPRRQWPSGMAALGVELTGRIAEGERAEPGQGVARLDGIGLSGRVREVLAPDAEDGLLPPDVRSAVRALLGAWAPRVDGVVVVSSSVRPRLVDHLAGGAAGILGVPVVGAFVARDGLPPGRHDLNSAQRLAVVARRLELELSQAALAGLPGKSVLLVDDYTDSGWTLTLAARLLRRAGASAVVPFVLGVR